MSNYKFLPNAAESIQSESRNKKEAKKTGAVDSDPGSVFPEQRGIVSSNTRSREVKPSSPRVRRKSSKSKHPTRGRTKARNNKKQSSSQKTKLQHALQLARASPPEGEAAPAQVLPQVPAADEYEKVSGKVAGRRIPQGSAPQPTKRGRVSKSQGAKATGRGKRGIRTRPISRNCAPSPVRCRGHTRGNSPNRKGTRPERFGSSPHANSSPGSWSSGSSAKMAATTPPSAKTTRRSSSPQRTSTSSDG